MADDFRTGGAARLAGDDCAQMFRLKMIRQPLDLRGFSASLTALECDEAPASRASLDCLVCHAQSFSTPARNMPIINSLAPSIARRMVDPTPTDSAA